jgi:hypothetical protein
VRRPPERARLCLACGRRTPQLKRNPLDRSPTGTASVEERYAVLLNGRRIGTVNLDPTLPRNHHRSSSPLAGLSHRLSLPPPPGCCQGARRVISQSGPDARRARCRGRRSGCSGVLEGSPFPKNARGTRSPPNRSGFSRLSRQPFGSSGRAVRCKMLRSNLRLKLSARGRRLCRNAPWKPSYLALRRRRAAA